MRAIATISQSALLHNLSVVKKYAPQAKVVAMVKANAYGHHLNLGHRIKCQIFKTGILTNPCKFNTTSFAITMLGDLQVCLTNFFWIGISFI
jgi:hypothetical protein